LPSESDRKTYSACKAPTETGKINGLIGGYHVQENKKTGVIMCGKLKKLL